MATLEERVAFLEGRVAEHSRGMDGIHDAIVHLEERMDRRFDSIDRRFESIDRRFELIDHRFESIDHRFESIDHRFESIEGRFESIEGRVDGLASSMERRFTAVEDKIQRSFVWIVGIQVTTLAAIVAALAAR